MSQIRSKCFECGAVEKVRRAGSEVFHTPRSAALGQMLASSSLTVLSLVPFSKAIRSHAIPGGLEEVGADAGKEERGGLVARLSCLSASAFVHGSPSAYSCRVPLLVIRGVAWV